VLGSDGKIEQKSEKLVVELLRGGAIFHRANMARLLPDAAVRGEVESYVHNLDAAALGAQLGEKGTLRFNYSQGGTKVQPVALTLGTHFFLSASAALAAGAFA